MGAKGKYKINLNTVIFGKESYLQEKKIEHINENSTTFTSHDWKKETFQLPNGSQTDHKLIHSITWKKCQKGEWCAGVIQLDK